MDEGFYILGILLLIALPLAALCALVLYQRNKKKKWIQHNPESCCIHFSVRRRFLTHWCAAILEIDGQPPQRSWDAVYAAPGTHHFEVCYSQTRLTFVKGQPFVTETIDSGRLRCELKPGRVYRCVYNSDSKRFFLEIESGPADSA